MLVAQQQKQAMLISRAQSSSMGGSSNLNGSASKGSAFTSSTTAITGLNAANNQLLQNSTPNSTLISTSSIIPGDKQLIQQLHLQQRLNPEYIRLSVYGLSEVSFS